MTGGHIITPDEAAAVEAMNTPELMAAQGIVNSLGPVLLGISNQLDLLIQLECGFLKRSTMKAQFEEAAEKARLAQVAAEASKNGHG